MTNYLILWSIIAIIALAIDMITSSFLFVWFTIGAIGAIIGEIFKFSFIIQIIIFIIVSGVFMVVGYPIVKKNIKDTVKPILIREKTYIGKELTVTQDMLDNSSIKIDGVYWKMITEDNEIKNGDKVKVIEVQGNKILVKKI